MPTVCGKWSNITPNTVCFTVTREVLKQKWVWYRVFHTFSCAVGSQRIQTALFLIAVSSIRLWCNHYFLCLERSKCRHGFVQVFFQGSMIIYPGFLQRYGPNVSILRRSIQTMHQIKLCVLCGSLCHYSVYARILEHIVENRKIGTFRAVRGWWP